MYTQARRPARSDSVTPTGLGSRGFVPRLQRRKPDRVGDSCESSSSAGVGLRDSWSGAREPGDSATDQRGQVGELMA